MGGQGGGGLRSTMSYSPLNRVPSALMELRGFLCTPLVHPPLPSPSPSPDNLFEV